MSITAIAFLLAFGALLVAALFRDPRFGLYAYIGTFYLHPIDRWWGSDLPDLRWSLIAAAVTLVATLRLPDQLVRPRWTANAGARLLIALATWIWFQNLWALSSEEHFDLSILFTKYVALIYLIYRLVDDEQNLRHFLIAHVLGCLYLGYLVLQAPDAGRLEGVGGPGIDEANALGMHLATGAMAAAALILRGTAPQRTFALAALVVIANGIIQTESRGAFLGAAAGGLTMFVVSPPRLRKYGVLLAFIGVAALVRLAPENYWERMGTITAPVEEEATVDQSSATRLELIKAQWRMFLAYPMGSGHRGTAYLSPLYLSDADLSPSRKDNDGERARSSHNTLMTALAEQGIPGVLAYVSFVVWIWRAGFTTRKQLQSTGADGLHLYLMAVMGSLATVFVAGMFTDYFKAEIFVWAVALLAVIRSLTQSSTVSADSKTANPTSSHPVHAELRPRFGSTPGSSAKSP